MRGSISTLIVFLISLIVVLLYQFLAKPQLAAQIASVRAENQELDLRLATIRQMELAMPAMMEKLPDWRNRLTLYRTAVPSEINDDVFLAGLNEQLLEQGVDLLRTHLVGPPEVFGLNESHG